MKHNIFHCIALLMVLFPALTGCNEDEFLKEKALSFYSSSNSFVTASDFERSVTTLYAQVRREIWGVSNVGSWPYFTSTDVAKDGREILNSTRFGAHEIYLVPTNSTVVNTWEAWYKLIANANTIIDRADRSSMSDSDKKRYVAEAKFFRAFGYRFLVYLFGGVPLITNEVTSPKTDYTRASKEEVLKQMAEDFAAAGAGLPDINAVQDGKVSKLVAYHFLSETYVALGEYQKAIDAASVVIDDPNTALMQNRFGSMATKKPTDPYLDFTQDGDVFWDLFRVGNQNRSSGNKEALWVCQFEVDVKGGVLVVSTTGDSGCGLNFMERSVSPIGYPLQDPSGKAGMLGSPQSTYNSGGSGVSLLQNTKWWLNDLWQSDWDNDIRNAPHNIVRDHVYTDPKSAYYKKSVLEYPSPTLKSQPWRWYPYPTKHTTPGQHPEGVYLDKELMTIKGGTYGGSTFRDQYYLRLAETYLMRAEAYLGAGDKQKAADDINEVRLRAKAKPISASDVTLDYILDERARELVYEEPRRITLHRTGTLVERVRKYNELNASEIKDHHGLWPIPNKFIEANDSRVIEQNPGY